ncbi:MAG TPA: exosortase A [Burkholderiaceae bacterium]|nr:exosortase A [Burkholderiaceae bacterium]
MTTAVATSERGAWQPALPALVLLLSVLLWIYRATALGMVEIWARSDTFMHAFLVVPISAWLIWRERTHIAAQVPEPAPWMLLPAAAVAGLWLLGSLAASNAVTQLAFVASLVLGVGALCGARATRAMLFPLLFLFFAVPLGEFMLPVLMQRTADFTVFALQLSGVPVYREGLSLTIPTGHWSIVEECSGVRYLIASFMVGTLFAYLNFNSLRKRLLFSVVSIVVPVVANWVRAYLIVLAGHLSGNKIATGVDHLIYGGVFFGFVMLLLYIIGSRWADPLPAPSASALASVARSDGPAPARIWLVTAGLIAVAVAPQLVLRSVEAGESAASVRMTPPALAGWSGSEAPETDWQPRFQNPSAVLRHTYERHGQGIGVHIAYYRQQGPGHKLVSSDNVLVHSEDKTWRKLDSGQETVRIAGRDIQVRTQRVRSAVRNDDYTLRLWQWYWVDGHLTDSDAWAKLWGIWQRVLGRGDDGAVIVLYTPETTSKEVATSSLHAFVEANGASITALLAEARNAR